MHPRHLLLALAVVAVWGTNFVVIHIGLDGMPPLVFATLRFVFALVPAVFFVKRPNVSWANLATYGVCGGAGQFGLLYIAMRGSISPGLASLVVQAQAFFTIAFAAVLTRERLRPFQLFALAVAAVGILVIASHADRTTTPLGLGLVLASAFCWGIVNIVMKRSGASNMFAYVVWASLFAVPPLVILSVAVEGVPAIVAALRQAGPSTWGAVVWQAVGNTLFGYAAWGWLLSRYQAATIAPLALLVPIFGMVASTIYLGEPMPVWKIIAAVLVLVGLAINTFASHLRDARTRAGA